MQASASQTKPKTKLNKMEKKPAKKYSPIVTNKLKKPLKKIRAQVKIQEKERRNNKVKPLKQLRSKTADRKKRKKKVSAVSKKSILKRKRLPLVSLPLAAGSAYPSFALVPIGDHKMGKALRAIVQPDQIVANDRESDFYDEAMSEQVGEMFSFRVERGDLSVKREVWAKIIRTLPENFVIPDPELTAFFDNMNAIQCVKEDMTAASSHDLTEETLTATDANDDRTTDEIYKRES